MRKFSSYGTIDKDLHYYVPRQELVDHACQQLVGDDPDKGGHYITVWAPRQRGKSWVMQTVAQQLQARGDFAVGTLVLQSAKNAPDAQGVRDLLVEHLRAWFERDFPRLPSWQALPQLFTARYFDQPVILILDEFDALPEADILACVNAFRDMFIQRGLESQRPSGEKRYLLHGLALIGVRAVLGVENQSGSPFNVQRSMRIPNLTAAEVQAMFHWYERESGQTVDPAVIDRVFYETQGQPGLVSWLGELLTEDYNITPDQPFTLAQFAEVYTDAIKVLPNNNILNIVSKARQAPYQEVVLELFRTAAKFPFTYDDSYLNFLYLNGVVDWERASPTERYTKFACPMVQKRLFNYFARTLFRNVGRLYPVFADLTDTITATRLYIKPLLRRYGDYLQAHREWLLKDAPRRQSDLRIYEAVYHFNLYMYVAQFLRTRGGHVTPEFPTGNGKIDLIIRYAGQQYGIEVKSFAGAYEYREALQQAAHYGQQLQLTEITLAMFIDVPVDDANRAKYETVYVDAQTGVTVQPVFVEIGPD